MKKFYVGIKGVIVSNDKVLLLKAERPDRTFWEVPGGRIDANETIEETLRRELGEEVPNIKNIHTHEVLNAFRVPKDIAEGTSLTLIFYRVSAEFDGEPELSHEHTDYQWASKEEAIDLVDESCKVAIANAFARSN